MHLLDKDHEVLVRFCAVASHVDGGQGAATSVLGAGLEDLASVVLGPGDWQPQPASWTAGTEKGQF